MRKKSFDGERSSHVWERRARRRNEWNPVCKWFESALGACHFGWTARATGVYCRVHTYAGGDAQTVPTHTIKPPVAGKLLIKTSAPCSAYAKYA